MKLRTFLVGAVSVILVQGTASATPSLSFLIDGDTFTQPFTITNSSDAGERVTRFQLNVAPPAMVYDTVDGGPPGNGTIGVPFTPRGTTATDTGLVPTAGPADGATLLDISFTDFNQGESFIWDIDIDGASGSPITVTGDLLAGALATIDFSDGQRLLGVLEAVGSDNSDASQFVVTGITVTPSVPEPGSLALIGLALAGVAAFRRKRSTR